MADWRTRVKRHGAKPADEMPAIDRELLLKKAAESVAAKAAQLEEQKEVSHQIAVGPVTNVLVELNEMVGGSSVQPIIEEHHDRMISVKSEVETNPVLVNILSLSNGNVRLTCFWGVSGANREQEFEPPITNEAISAWLGEQLADFLDTAA